MPDTPHNSPDEALLGAALQMVDVWSRLSPEKQALLLKRFGTQENALAALGACPRWAAQQPPCQVNRGGWFWGGYATRRGQAPSPQQAP
eukprot:gene18938-24208_t